MTSSLTSVFPFSFWISQNAKRHLLDDCTANTAFVMMTCDYRSLLHRMQTKNLGAAIGGGDQPNAYEIFVGNFVNLFSPMKLLP